MDLNNGGKNAETPGNSSGRRARRSSQSANSGDFKTPSVEHDKLAKLENTSQSKSAISSDNSQAVTNNVQPRKRGRPRKLVAQESLVSSNSKHRWSDSSCQIDEETQERVKSDSNGTSLKMNEKLQENHVPKVVNDAEVKPQRDEAAKISSSKESSPAVKKRGRPKKLLMESPDRLDKSEAEESDRNTSTPSVIVTGKRQRTVNPKYAEDLPESKREANTDAPEVGGVKRKRGRPPKTAQVGSDEDRDGDADYEPECTPLTASGKRRRTQNPKYREKSLHPEKSACVDTPEHRGAKRKRGRPPKITNVYSDDDDDNADDKTLNEKDSSQRAPHVMGSSASEPESTPSAVSGKRQRAQNPKYREESHDSEEFAINSNISEDRGIRRKRGRPPKALKVDSNDENDKREDRDVVNKKKRKIARRKTSQHVVESSDSDGDDNDEFDSDYEEPPHKRKKRENIKTPKGRKKKEAKDSGKKICALCNTESKDLVSIKRHMMTVHSLLWKADHPEGIQSSSQIIKILGFIDCQKCKKRFRFPQYYNHHLIWCGREGELAQCEICSRSVKAMWLQQHVTAHRTAQKKLERQEVLDKELAAKRKEEEAEDAEEDARMAAEGKTIKSKRKAAKSALKHMSKVKDEATGDNDDADASGSDKYTQSSDEESESEDDDDYEEEEEDGEGGQKTSRKWRALFAPTLNQPARSRLQKVEEFYSNQLQEQLFPKLQPLREQWKSLSAKEKTTYMPPSKASSVAFTTCVKRASSSKTNGFEDVYQEHGLCWGQSCAVEGNTHFCSTGAYIRALEWCPLPSSADSDQVVAVATDLMDGMMDSNRAVDGPGLLQFWSMGNVKQERAPSDAVSAPPVTTSLQFCVAHDSGRVRSMSWCPRQVFDQAEPASHFLQRMGLLAVACSNGKVLIYSIPQLSAVQTTKESVSSNEAVSAILFVKPEATLTLELNFRPACCGPCMCVAWQQGGDCRYIASGYGTGTIVLWDIINPSPHIQPNESRVRPLRIFQRHRAPVVSLVWCPQLPYMLASSSLDFHLCLTDVSRPGALFVDERKGQTSLFKSLCWAGPLYFGVFCAEESLAVSTESGVKYLGLTYRTIERKKDVYHLVHNNTAATWDVDFCPYTELAVGCDANGKVKIFLVDMEKLTKDKGKKGSNINDPLVFSTALLYRVQMIKNETSQFPSAPLENQEETLGTEHHQLTESSSGEEPPPQTMLCTNRFDSGDAPLSVPEKGKCESKDALQNAGDEDTLKEPESALKEKGVASIALSASGVSLDKDSCVAAKTGPSETTTQCSAENYENTKGDPRCLHKDSNDVTNSVDITTTKSSQQTDSVTQKGRVEACSDSRAIKDGPVNGRTINALSSNWTQNLSDLGNLSFMAAKNISQVSDETNDTAIIPTGKRSACLSHQSAEQRKVALASGVANGGAAEKDLVMKNTFVIHFEGPAKVEFENGTKKRKDDCVENIAAPNKQTVCTVRLNPNPHRCGWLASGGQSGLLRLDDLSKVLARHRIVINNVRAKVGGSS